MKLNLGCGNKEIHGFIGVDKLKEVKPDLIADLEKNLPFKNNSIKEIKIFHVLEHIHNFFGLMHEIYRICRNHAIIEILTPYYKSGLAFSTPTHVRFFTGVSFNYNLDGFKVLKIKRKNLGKKKFIPFKSILDYFLWDIYQTIYYKLEVLKNGSKFR